jgi:hypothetical protein
MLSRPAEFVVLVIRNVVTQGVKRSVLDTGVTAGTECQLVCSLQLQALSGESDLSRPTLDERARIFSAHGVMMPQRDVRCALGPAPRDDDASAGAWRMRKSESCARGLRLDGFGELCSRKVASPCAGLAAANAIERFRVHAPQPRACRVGDHTEPRSAEVSVSMRGSGPVTTFGRRTGAPQGAFSVVNCARMTGGDSTGDGGSQSVLLGRLMSSSIGLKESSSGLESQCSLGWRNPAG